MKIINHFRKHFQILRTFLQKKKYYFDPFNISLKKSRGVIHIGANDGQERYLYNKIGLRVIWIEAIPEVFEGLQKNIEKFKNQQGFQYLLSEKDNIKYNFYVANNRAGSSSIFPFKDHVKMFPTVQMTHTIELYSATFKTFIRNECIDLQGYDFLVLDTQGSELLILRGAGELLSLFKYVQVEVADFEAYDGCCLANEVDEYLGSFGLRECSRKIICCTKQGTYWDVLYKK